MGNHPGLEAVPAVEVTFDWWAAPHVGVMRGLAVRLVGPSEADDVVQDSLTRAWRRWSTFDDGKGSPRAWLLAIVADRARAHRRRPWRSPWVVEEAVAGYEPDVDLQRALARLTHRQRLAVELHYYLGVPVREAAEVMGCSEGTVKSTLFDARRRLHDLLGAR